MGYLQKLSRKGWVCKTQEGELAMTTVPGVAPLLWNFSVWDDEVAKKLDGQMGKRVVLHYREFRYIPTTCFGETTYFVDRVEILDYAYSASQPFLLFEEVQHGSPVMLPSPQDTTGCPQVDFSSGMCSNFIHHYLAIKLSGMKIVVMIVSTFITPFNR